MSVREAFLDIIDALACAKHPPHGHPERALEAAREGLALLDTGPGGERARAQNNLLREKLEKIRNLAHIKAPKHGLFREIRTLALDAIALLPAPAPATEGCDGA